MGACPRRPPLGPRSGCAAPGYGVGERSDSAVQNVRDLPLLWPYRQRRHLVVACMDDPSTVEALEREIEGLGGVLVVEREAGPLSDRLGRPSVTIADRFGTVALTV